MSERQGAWEGSDCGPLGMQPIDLCGGVPVSGGAVAELPVAVPAPQVQRLACRAKEAGIKYQDELLG